MNKGAFRLFVCRNKYQPTFQGRHNPAQCLFVDRAALLPIVFPRIEIIMTKLRLVLLATTAITMMPFASSASHAQTAAPVVVAQQRETGPDGKPKPPPT